MSNKGKGISFRPKEDVRSLLEDLAEATERPKTYFLDKCVEAYLPALEVKYSSELKQLLKRRAENYKLNDRISSEKSGEVNAAAAKIVLAEGTLARAGAIRAKPKKAEKPATITYLRPSRKKPGSKRST